MYYNVIQMLGLYYERSNCLMGNISSREAKMNKESKLLNTCTRLNSVVGVLYNCGTSPSQVPVWKREHEITAEITSLLLTKVSGSQELRLLGW